MQHVAAHLERRLRGQVQICRDNGRCREIGKYHHRQKPHAQLLKQAVNAVEHADRLGCGDRKTAPAGCGDRNQAVPLIANLLGVSFHSEAGSQFPVQDNGGAAGRQIMTERAGFTGEQMEIARELTCRESDQFRGILAITSGAPARLQTFSEATLFIVRNLFLFKSSCRYSTVFGELADWRIP